MTVVIVTVVIVTVVIVNLFSKNNFNILTTKEIFEGQRFAILEIFLFCHRVTLELMFSSVKLEDDRVFENEFLEY